MIIYIEADQNGAPIIYDNGHFRVYATEQDAIENLDRDQLSTLAIDSMQGEILMSIAHKARRNRYLESQSFPAFRMPDGRIVPLKDLTSL